MPTLFLAWLLAAILVGRALKALTRPHE
jgi:hypothetical protein